MTTTKKKAKKPTVAERIAHLGPCKEAQQWANGYTSPAKAWNVCQRGDWLLWIVGKCSGPPESDGRKKLVPCACECARLALPIYEKQFPQDNRVRKCIETAERWARGQATIKELREARAAAYSAYSESAYSNYSSADAADSAYSSAAAADCDSAAAESAYSAYAAAAANSAAAVGGAHSAAADAYSATALRWLTKCSKIVRKHCHRPPVLAGDEVSQ